MKVTGQFGRDEGDGKEIEANMFTFHYINSGFHKTCKKMGVFIIYNI